MRVWRRPAGTFCTVVALTASLVACGSGSEDGIDAAAAQTRAAPLTAQELAEFDVIATASAENNPLFADIFAVSLNDLMVRRVTENKRISAMDATTENIVVAAAEGGSPDRLAFVTPDGNLAEIPGLGRPFAFSPSFRGRAIVYDDIDEADVKAENRYFTWDLESRKRRLLFRSADELSGAVPGPGGQLLLSRSRGAKLDLIVRSPDGDITKLNVDGVAGASGWGNRLIHANLYGTGDRFGDSPTGLVLLDPTSGKQRRIDGVVGLGWNPAGDRLLVRYTDSTTDSRLGILDPDKPSDINALGTIPGLVIYTGAWVR